MLNRGWNDGIHWRLTDGMSLGMKRSMLLVLSIEINHLENEQILQFHRHLSLSI